MPTTSLALTAALHVVTSLLKAAALAVLLAAEAVALHPVTVGLIGISLLVALGLVVVLLRWAGSVGPSQTWAGRLQTVYEDSRMPAFLTSSSGRVIWTNGAARQAGLVAGRKLSEVIRNVADLDEAGLYRLSRRALDLGFALSPSEEAKTRNGEYLAAQSGDGRTLVWTLQPAEHESMRSLVRHDTAFESARFGHISVAPDGRIATNARFRKIFGDDPKAILDQLPADRPPEGGRVVLPLADGRHGLVRVFVLDPEARGKERDYVFFLTDDDSGLLGGPSAALEAVPMALLRLDLHGRVLWVNSVAKQLLGPGLAIGEPLTSIVEPLGRPVQAMIQSALRGLPRSKADMVRLARDDVDVYLSVSLTRARLDENDSLVALLADASEIRELEDQFAQSQKMEAIGQLAGGVAHDFNNVLTAVAGHVDLLLLGKDPSHPDYSDLIQVRQNANRAAALVRQLLAFSRKQALAPETLAVHDVISDTLYLLNRLIGENVTLKVDQARDLWTVRADQQQLEQALMNLVVNAKDAMPEGGVITIRTRNRTFSADGSDDPAHQLPGEFVEITVEDDGPGIPADLVDRVFEPFFTTKPVGEGTGLGLSTVYGIVKQSGGSITAGNVPGGGARFRINLPRSREDEEAAEAAAEQQAEDEEKDGPVDMTGRGTILLVEDEAPVRSFATRALQLRGYHVEAVESAEAGMEYLEQPSNVADLIVSDVVMPGMDGPTFAAEARKLRPGLKVVFVSGYAEDTFRNTLAGDDFLFLPKPFSLTELTAKVKEALG